MFTWIKDRLSERTSMDGAAIIAVALIVLFLSPFAKIPHTLVSHMGYGVFGNLNND